MSGIKLQRTMFTLFISSLLGAVILLSLSFAQKIIAGFNPYVLKGYLIPFVFGSVSGSVIGLIFSRLQDSKFALQNSEAKYRTMMEALPDPIYICSSKMTIEYVNPAMIERLGEDVIGKKCYEMLHGFNEPCDWCCHKKVMEGRSHSGEITSPKDNSVYLVSSTPFYDGAGKVAKLTVFRDITETRAIEKQLRQSQKMESIGTLAGGIAHDFNNILGIILGYTELLELSLEKESADYENIQQIKIAANRAADLVKQILAFSRQTEQELRPISVSIIVKEVAKMLRATMPSTIDIRYSVKGDTQVMGEPGHIHQIIMNICTNAGHAMEMNGGVLSIEVDRIELYEELISDRVALHPGNYVRLSITDTGEGIPDEVIDRIFEPFFTTKPPGVGTGMGLSVVHGIVESLNGGIYVYSEEGIGTTFRIYLPALEQQIDKKNDQKIELLSGKEHILLVDDEDALVRITAKRLEQLGYKVTGETDSSKAKELFEKQPSEYDLLLTDMTMPKMTGEELALEIRKIRPALPVIVCTGYSSILKQQRKKAADVDKVLMKPVDMYELTVTLRQLLEKEAD